MPTPIRSPDDAPSGGDGRGLVRIGTAGVARLGLPVIALFLLLTAGTGLVDSVWPLPRPELFGIEREEDEALRQDARLFDGSATELFEYDLRLRSRVRRAVSPHYALALYRWLDETGQRVVAGREGWLFLRGRAMPEVSDPEAVTAGSAALLAAVGRRLTHVGVDLWVVPVPRKAVLCREFLPRGIDPREELDRQLARALDQRGVHSVNLGPVFAAAPDPAALFYRRDSHWTDAGERLAAEAICSRIGCLAYPSERSTSLEPGPPRRRRVDLPHFVGLTPIPSLPEDLQTEASPTFVVLDAQGDKLDYEVPAAMTRIALAGTSFSALGRLPLYLEHYAGERVFNTARAATTPVVPMLALIRRWRASLPEILILETPANLLFKRGSLPMAGDVFAEIAPGACVSLDISLPFHPSVGERGLRVRRSPQKLARLEPGALFHTGEGLVLLRLRGRILDGPVAVDVQCGDARLSVSWPEELRELYVPLVSDDVSTQVDVWVRSTRLSGPSPRIGIKDLELVLDAASAGVRRLEPTEPADPSSVRLAPVGDGWLGEGAVLSFQWNGSPAFSIRARTASGRERAWEIAGAAVGARVLVGLGAFAGEELEEVEVGTEGSAEGAVGSASLYPGPGRSRD